MTIHRVVHLMSEVDTSHNMYDQPNCIVALRLIQNFNAEWCSKDLPEYGYDCESANTELSYTYGDNIVEDFEYKFVFGPSCP